MSLSIRIPSELRPSPSMFASRARKSHALYATSKRHSTSPQATARRTLAAGVRSSRKTTPPARPLSSGRMMDRSQPRPACAVRAGGPAAGVAARRRSLVWSATDPLEGARAGLSAQAHPWRVSTDPEITLRDMHSKAWTRRLRRFEELRGTGVAVAGTAGIRAVSHEQEPEENRRRVFESKAFEPETAQANLFVVQLPYPRIMHWEEQKLEPEVSSTLLNAGFKLSRPCWSPSSSKQPSTLLAIAGPVKLAQPNKISLCFRQHRVRLVATWKRNMLQMSAQAHEQRISDAVAEFLKIPVVEKNILKFEMIVGNGELDQTLRSLGIPKSTTNMVILEAADHEKINEPAFRQIFEAATKDGSFDSTTSQAFSADFMTAVDK
ncbi:hypothetical protein FB451DRAFT_1375690 [Mycena latifolia]|nr:hypothetical protein FB451DRAFT_1375690 [Mycena latifolia]